MGLVLFYVHRHEGAATFFNPKLIIHRALLPHKYVPVPNLNVEYVNKGSDEILKSIGFDLTGLFFLFFLKSTSKI